MNKLMFALLILLIFVSSALLLFNWNYIVDIKYVNMKVKADDIFGINVNSTSLDFGRTSLGSQVSREINLTNNFKFAVTAKIMNSGNITPFVSVSQSEVNILPGEKVTIAYFVDIPIDAVKGEYVGQSRVVFMRRSI
ncbi:MAG: hypothetical protein NDI94_04560 [Candidatus Woesearchaeota archaeon]|nr:hypothetical protein [Candidatus Woesearchaeota archaeon]